MTHETQNQADNGVNPDRQHRTRSGLSWTTGLALVSVGIVIGCLGTVVTNAGAHGWRYGHPMYGYRTDSAAKTIKRVQNISDWVLGSVDATDEQRERIDAILADAVTDIYPLRAEHLEHESHWIAELSRPAIDRDGLERIRAAEFALAEQAITRALDATVAISEVLDAEQRRELVTKLLDFWH